MDNKQVMALKENGEKPEQDIVVQQGVEIAIAQAEKQVDILEKVLQIAIKRTNHFDWVDQMGKPYLTASGAEKLMPLFGINMANTSYDKKFSKDEKGDYYIYQYKATFSWKGGSLEAIGACSSRDKFFAWDSREQSYKPLFEVDETNIMKAAYTNMLVNGITRLLGIRNLTWEQLKDYGIDKERVSRVEYKSNKTTKPKTTNDTILTCQNCDKIITNAEKKYSESKFGKALCRECQRQESKRS